MGAARRNGGGGPAVRTELASELSRRELLARARRARPRGRDRLGAAGRRPDGDPGPAPSRQGLIDGTLQAFFDTIIPGKPVPDLLTELGNPIDPRAIAGVDPEHGAVYTDALALARNPRIGFAALEPAFVADLTARALAEGGAFLDLDYEARERVCLAGLAFSNPDRIVWEAAAAIPFTAFCAAANVPDATSDTSAGYAVMGHPGAAPTATGDFSYGTELNRGRTKNGNSLTDPWAERVDVCIVGSGFGGSIAAWRLAELYRAADQDASVVVLERGKRFGHTDFRQSMDVEHLSDVYELIQGQGAQIVVANLVGGGSNLYLAASLRSPSRDVRAHGPPSRRRAAAADVAAGDQPPQRSTATTRAPRRGLRVRQPSWKEVSKSGGVWAAMLREAGHTCDRVPVAIDFERCVDAKWCYTGCVFGAKNSLITNYLPSAERRGVEVRPLVQVNEVVPSRARARTAGSSAAATVDPETKQPTGPVEIECKVAILAAGAMGTPPILMRSRRSGALPASRRTSAATSGSTATTSPRSRSTRSKAKRVLGLPRRLRRVLQGQADHDDELRLLGRQAGQRARRDPLHPPGDPPLPAHELPLRRRPLAAAREPTWWGREKKRSISSWSRHIEILAMVEETIDGEFFAVPPTGNGHVQPNGGPVGIGLFSYSLSEQSARIRERADAAIKQIAERRGSAGS